MNYDPLKKQPYIQKNIENPVIQAGNRILEESKHYFYQSSVTSAHIVDQAVQASTSSLKEGMKSTWKLTDSVASNTLSQINRYTPDVYDVGHRGQGDLTSEMGSFALGNSAMLLQNTVRAARYPVANALNIGQKLYYNDDRMEKIKNHSQDHLNSSPLTNLHYVEIATGHSQRDIVMNRDRYAWNRYRLNDAKGLSLKEKGYLINKRFQGKRYERILSHQSSIQRYSKHLANRQFSLKRSTMKMISNQSRKIGNEIIQGNDTNSTTNRTMWYVSKTARGSVKTGAMVWKNRQAIIRNMRSVSSIIRHPIQSAKHLFNVLLSMFTSIGGILSTIPVVASVIMMLLPVFIVCICIVSIFTSLFGWYIDSHGYTFHEIKLCDIGNQIKDIANVSAITNKDSQQYKLLFEDAGGLLMSKKMGSAGTATL